MALSDAGAQRLEGRATERRLKSAKAWQTLPVALQDALERNGIYTASEFTNLFDGSAAEARELSVELSQSERYGSVLLELHRECLVWHHRYVTDLSRDTDAEASASAVKRARHAEHLRLKLISPPLEQNVAGQSATAARRVKWPTALRRKIAQADGRGARESAEAQERHRWVSLLRSQLVAANLPIVDLATSSSNPESVWDGIGHGLRARTLRRRVKDWEKISRYCMLATGSPWPRTVSVFLDFLHVLVQSAAPPSALKAMKCSLHFFERAGAVATCDKIADHSSITARIREYEATSGRLVAPTRKAPHLR